MAFRDVTKRRSLLNRYPCAVLSATPNSFASDKNVTYSRQYLHASISMSATSSLLCRPLRLCFAAYASRNMSAIACIVFFEKPYNLWNCSSRISNAFSNFVFIPSLSEYFGEYLIFEEVYYNYTHPILSLSVF